MFASHNILQAFGVIGPICANFSIVRKMTAPLRYIGDELTLFGANSFSIGIFVSLPLINKMYGNKIKPILDETTVDKNPFRQFEQWYGEAYRLLGEEASAMTLSTEANHHPDARIIYLRGSDKKGFWFFTNYNSQKAKEIKKNNKACLLFFWARMNRQVRMCGTIEKLSAKESDIYFANRQRESQIGAWASPQSKTIASREMLEAWVNEFTKLFEDISPYEKEKKIPRPSHWGGYRFVPVYFEFWYGRESRLHDRIVFTKQKNGKWKIERLAP